ncbi:hypothetical protein HF086_004488 [Spodoptera exigua]|uniref:Uncharacterized protein n=1 Tax=Spodoptera exigua TaxID=7107 RepID=A0A922M563_SPOEX|nr:hypothetical protein HF086_004488 [Spodoptera exigua]
MKCAKLHLQQRVKGKLKRDDISTPEKPRRYCQRKLVNPNHEEDPRWIDIFDRFHVNTKNEEYSDVVDSVRDPQENEDMVLTVQTLKFQGDVDQTTRPRTSFKYKKNTDVNKHRMFVKQPVSENDFSDDDDRSSQLTYYYFDEYLKYIYSTDRSRPASSISSTFLKGFNKDKQIQNKATQVETSLNDTKKPRRVESKIKNNVKKYSKRQVTDEIKDVAETIENTKITYQKSGKRKSLTISRAQSPETVQVIRVDVVCNYTNSATSDYEDHKKIDSPTERLESIKENDNIIKKKYFSNKYSNPFATKYLLTNTIKSLDENLSGGAKVTLLCKTFKLSDRLIPEKPERERKFPKATKAKKSYKLKSNKIKHHNIIY